MEEGKNKMGGFYALDFESEAIVPTSTKKLNLHYISFTRLFFNISRFRMQMHAIKILYEVIYIKSNLSYWSQGENW